VFAALGSRPTSAGRGTSHPVSVLVRHDLGDVRVGWCVLLYTLVLAAELRRRVRVAGLKRWRDFMLKLTVGLTVAAVVLSTLHQPRLEGCS